METLAGSLIGGLLSGGVAGAIISGFVSLRRQRREFENARQTRFVELKRERYAELLRLADTWTANLWDALNAQSGKARNPGQVAVQPGTTREIESLAYEVELLASEAVASAAIRLAMAVRGLAEYYAPSDPANELARQLVSGGEVSQEFTYRRNLFLKAARADLGIG